MDLDYKPSMLQIEKIKLWWWLPIITLTGALLGLLVSFFLKPQYEAVSKLITNFEINLTDEITEIMLDGAIYHVGDLVYDPGFMQQVVISEKAKGNSITTQDLKDIATVERQVTATLIRIKYEDPEVAARIANTWGQIVYAGLQEAYKQSLLTNELEDLKASLEQCLSVTDNTAEENPYCSHSIENLTDAIQNLTLEIADARNKSLGLHELLFVSDFIPAQVPALPLNFNRGVLIFSGSIIGFIIGIFVVEARAKKLQKSA
jgi:uncharacterized protein involved in exopolysaccharide biosynthesis